MKTYRWFAKQRGRTVCDGTVQAETDRKGMEQLLQGRTWSGDDWSLKVGDASLSFDEADVEKLGGLVADEHAKDEAMPPSVAECIQALDPYVDRIELERVKETSLGVTPNDLGIFPETEVEIDYRPARQFGRAIMDTSIMVGVRTPCCSQVVAIRIPSVKPSSVAIDVDCGCNKHYVVRMATILMVHDEFRVAVDWEERS